MKRLLNGEKRRIAIVAAIILFAAIAFYEILEHFPAVRGAVSTFLRVVAPIVYGLCFAFVVNLPMSFIETKLLKKLRAKRPGLTRAIAIIVSYVIVLGLVCLVISLIIPKVVESVYALVDNLGDYIAAVSANVDKMKDQLIPEVYNVLDKGFADLMQKANAFAVSFLQRIPKLTVSVIGVVYSIVVTLVISIHALIKKEKLLEFAKRTAMASVPEKSIGSFLGYCGFANRTFRKYITGQLTSCLIIGVLCYVGMRIFGMPYPELISVFIAVGALVPIVGPWASTIPSALIIFMSRQDSPLLALWFLVMIVGIQLLDDNLVYPRIVGDAVGIPGILVIASVIIAGGLFGIGGLLIAVPTAAVIRRIFTDWVSRRNAERAEKAEAEGSPVMNGET
ncbi:MAG: AI-2E family transporter [Clostridiales bacterium]|nr:AI-2E family transporter [Clostridiales bacterium]